MKFSSKLTAEYQAEIPKKVRLKLGLEAGDTVMFEERDDEIIIVKVESLDWKYLKAVSQSLEEEWLSAADEAAYADL